MRWPLSLLFRGARDAPAAAAGPAGGSGAPAGEPASTMAVPPRPADWKGLAPVQRTVGPAPVTAPAGPFARGLATRRRPDPILRPLAHDVVADGPAGLVSGLASPLVAPVGASPAHPEPSTLPVSRDAVQRRPRTTSVVIPPLGEGSAGEAGAGSGAALPPAAVRTLPAGAAAGPAVALAATRVAPGTAPEPPRPLARATGSPVQRSAAPTLPVPATADAGAGAPAAGRPGAPEPVPAPVAGPPPEPLSRPDEGPASSPDDAGPPVQRRTLGESRRLGLGAPIARRPEPRPPLSVPSDLPLARPSAPAAPPIQAASAAPAPLPVLRLARSPGAPSGSPGGAGMEASLGVSSADGSPAAMPAPAASAAPTASDDGGTGPTAPATRPLLGDPARRPATPPGEPPDDAGEASGEPVQDGGPPLAVARRATDAGPAEGAAPAAQAMPALPAAPAASAAPLAGIAAARPGEAAASRGALRSTAPLVAARAVADARPSLRSTVAQAVPPGPQVVVARHATGPDAGPTGLLARTGGGLAPGGGLARTDGGLAPGGGSPAPGGASVQRTAADAAAAGRPGPLPRPGSRPGGPPVSVATAPAPGAGALPLAREFAETPALPVVSRLATADDAAASPAGTVLGWTPAGGFAPVPASVGPVVQRVVEIGEVAGQAEPAAAGTAAPSDGGTGAAPDYEEIAEHVYDRIRSRFAVELLLDRERMGLLIDG